MAQLSEIINEIKREFGFEKDADLARALDIPLLKVNRYVTGDKPHLNNFLEFLSTLTEKLGLNAYYVLTKKGDLKWKGKADEEMGFLLDAMLKDENAKKSLYHFLKWQEKLHSKENP